MKAITTDEQGRRHYRLSAKDRKSVNKTVVYRLGRYHTPKLGKLTHRNPWPDWELGAWVVRDDCDGRTYVLESHAGAHWRPASPQDIEHYRSRRKAQRTRDRDVAAVANRELEGGAPTTRVPSVPAQKSGDMAGRAAAAVEQELNKKKKENG